MTSRDSFVWRPSRRDLARTSTLACCPLFPVASGKMAIQTPDTVQAVEWEMTNYQRNLVDTCFEEGNYDSAISLLDNLRHPSTKPFP